MMARIDPNGTELAGAVAAAACSVLETMFFSEAEACPEVPPEQQEAMHCVGVRFDGGMRGEFLIGVDPRVAVVLAAGFLGLDEAEVSSEETEQVLRETANMICGAALSRIEAEDHMRLETPQLVEAAVAVTAEGYLREFFVTPDGNIVTGVRLG